MCLGDGFCKQIWMWCVDRVWPKPCHQLREDHCLPALVLAYQKKIMAFISLLSLQQHHHYICSSNFGVRGRHRKKVCVRIWAWNQNWIAFSWGIPTCQLSSKSCSWADCWEQWQPEGNYCYNLWRDPQEPWEWGSQETTEPSWFSTFCWW